MTSELWERLVGGGCSRVLVLGPDPDRSMVAIHFPQTLGLPPVIAHNYLRYPGGPLRSQPDLLGLAARLAEDERWIAEGLAWAEAFMPRAEAIISVETAYSVMQGAQTPNRTFDATALWRAFRRLRRQTGQDRDAHEGVESLLDIALEEPILVRSSAAWPVRRIAEEQYGEKLIHVRTRSQIRALRKTRALPPGESWRGESRA